jgi:2-oxoisovalerate dehydrogenase E1 component
VTAQFLVEWGFAVGIVSTVRAKWTDEFRLAADQVRLRSVSFLGQPENRDDVFAALRIRAVESALYDAFGKGQLHGTIHTCIGQEFSGVAICRKLERDDFVTSNHRCHGHFIATTGQWRGLVDELVGNIDGVCAGIGSSQHLCDARFISNGQQGGLLPVAAGMALDRKLAGKKAVIVSFIGEGTLGEGVLYETANIANLWNLPHLIVCENNGYSQSTPQVASVAGDIGARAEAFGSRVFKGDTWDLETLNERAAQALDYVRNNSRPALLIVQTYRLNPHSKGDDQRAAEEIKWFSDRDPVNVAIEEIEEFAEAYEAITAEVSSHLATAMRKPKLSLSDYRVDQLPRTEAVLEWSGREPSDGARGAQQLNEFYGDWLESDVRAVFLGEDIADPYGGAFKVSKGFTTRFPERALTTPISEAAITGVGIGLALAGRRALVEIMFGDFITLAFDQIINNASKFFHMYNRKLSCPVIVRAPMGGRRGYGPTHSQSLERFLLGIDNCCLISPNSLIPLNLQLEGLKSLRCPAIIAENKIDYTLRAFVPDSAYVIEVDNELFPTVRIAPSNAEATVTILSYGAMARFVADLLPRIFDEGDAICELIAPTALNPFDPRPVLESTARTGRLVVVEEGSISAGFGAEAIAKIAELAGNRVVSARLGSYPMPPPSAPALEAEVLPNFARLVEAIAAVLGK